MKRMRLLMAGLGAVLLTVGYLASQRAYFSGQAQDYASKVDQPQIALLALVLFVAAVVLLFVPGSEEAED